MNNYLYIPVSYLEKLDISKKEFMQNSPKSQRFLENLISQYSIFSQIKQTLLVRDYFVLVLEMKTNIRFNDDVSFDCFTDYIQFSRFKNNIVCVDQHKKEVFLRPGTPSVFYSILNEFVVRKNGWICSGLNLDVAMVWKDLLVLWQ